MAEFYRAIPLDSSSKQPGDKNWKQLTDDGSSAKFHVTNTGAGNDPKIMVTTKKSGKETSKTYDASVDGNEIYIDLTHAQFQMIFNSADGGDWDYVKITAVADNFNLLGNSELYALQGGVEIDSWDWPPA